MEILERHAIDIGISCSHDLDEWNSQKSRRQKNSFCIFDMSYLSPKVLDETLVKTVVPIVTDKQFLLDYIQKIDVHELAAKLKH